jgi:hypothetical protein
MDFRSRHPEVPENFLACETSSATHLLPSSFPAASFSLPEPDPEQSARADLHNPQIHNPQTVRDADAKLPSVDFDFLDYSTSRAFPASSPGSPGVRKSSRDASAMTANHINSKSASNPRDEVQIELVDSLFQYK